MFILFRDRDEEIFKLARKGVKKSTLAKKFKISYTRVSYILYEMNRNRFSPFKDRKYDWMCNKLKNALRREDITPEMMFKMSVKQLKAIKGIGQKSAEFIFSHSPYQEIYKHEPKEDSDFKGSFKNDCGETFEIWKHKKFPLYFIRGDETDWDFYEYYPDLHVMCKDLFLLNDEEDIEINKIIKKG